MARYRVPKFIEKEPKIIGPMTFKQFTYIGVAGLISAVLYFTVSLIPFVLSALLLFAVAMALAFITVGGKSLPEIILHSVSFLFSSKVYLWKKKQSTPKIIEKREKKQPQQTDTKQSPLRMTQKSRLKEMETKVKTGKK
ncbi:MAG: PrgI family protein [Candidatus Paceibacterota bacterium]